MNTNSSITQLNELPKYFAIKRDANNPLWNKYITWLNETYENNLSGDAFSYYGYDGFSANWFYNINNFKNPVTELTLEQWDSVVNKKNEYVLKQDGMYTIEDLKNGKCTVINDGTPEELDIVLSAAEGNPCSRTYIKLACSKYYWTKNNYFWSNGDINKYNLPTQSVKEFIKQINMNKEIIGYRLVKREYEKSVYLIINANIGYYSDRVLPIEKSPKSIEKLKEAGVLDLWFEPVYKEDKTLPKINGYEGEFVDDLNGYFIRYGCATFNIQFINELHGLIGRNKVLFGNKDIKSIKLNSDVEITTEQIKQIYEYIQEKL
jgi:hypothetical protein